MLVLSNSFVKRNAPFRERFLKPPFLFIGFFQYTYPFCMYRHIQKIFWDGGRGIWKKHTFLCKNSRGCILMNKYASVDYERRQIKRHLQEHLLIFLCLNFLANSLIDSCFPVPEDLTSRAVTLFILDTRKSIS